jgi:hypothetical protein
MSIRWAYLKRILAGAIFGLYMAHLLYFLNPQIEITLGRLALVTTVYGLTCGLLFGSLLWGFRALRVRTIGKPDAFQTHGFGFVVLAAFASSFIYWLHLVVVRIYLPIGAVRILSKATTVITATAFILLALWVLERNADRRTSRSIFVAGVILIFVSAIFLYQRRESYRTETRDVVVASIGEVAGHRPVVLVAIRNLPHDWIVTMRGEGLLPFFDAEAEASYFTRLEPFPSTHWLSLWASLATGKLPYRHGMTGRSSYHTPLNREQPFLLLPYGVGFRTWGLIPPVERVASRLPTGSSLPVWSLFDRLQLSTSVIVWPSVETSALGEVDLGDLPGRFLTDDPAQPQILSALAGDVAALRKIDGRADITVLGIEGFSAAQRALHVYLNELAPRESRKGDGVRAYMHQLDRALAAVRAALPEHLIVICSPSAVVPPELPSTAWALAQNRFGRDPGADDGFLLVIGPGTAHRENPEPAFVVDVVPTILFGAGLPIGRDMDGRIMTEAFAEETLRRSTLSAIQTYEAETLLVRRSGP